MHDIHPGNFGVVELFEIQSTRVTFLDLVNQRSLNDQMHWLRELGRYYL